MTICGVVLSSCSTVPPPKEIPREQLVKQDNALGLELSHQFEDKLKIRGDREIQNYLANLADKLSVSNVELKSTHTGVFLIEDHEGKWEDFSLPGNRIYLSLGYVKSVEFENELAAMVAMELGHIAKRQVMMRLQKIRDLSPPGPSAIERAPLITPAPAGDHAVDFLGPAGLFEYGDGDLAAAAETAVDLLYNAGYDPRGLVAIWNRYAERPDHSPYDTATVEKVVERVRRAIALYLPLRNPIVRSRAFLGIEKRIGRL